VELIPLSAGMRMLCHMALSSEEVREWLRAQEPAAELEPGGALLDKLSLAPFADGESAAGFLASLNAAEERTLSAFDLRHPLPEPLPRAKQTWTGLLAQKLALQIEGLKNRLGRPGLENDERIKIQKLILDLKIRVADVHRPFQ